MSQVGYGGNDTFGRTFRLEVPLTGFSIDMADGPSTLTINPAGTLATGTVLLPANPLDGQRVEIISTQTQTALTITAATGDSIVGAATALVALVGVKYAYRKADRTWYPQP